MLAWDNFDAFQNEKQNKNISKLEKHIVILSPEMASSNPHVSCFKIFSVQYELSFEIFNLSFSGFQSKN